MTGMTIRQVRLLDRFDYQAGLTIRRGLSDRSNYKIDRSDYETGVAIRQIQLSDISDYQTGLLIRQIRLSDRSDYQTGPTKCSINNIYKQALGLSLSLTGY